MIQVIDNNNSFNGIFSNSFLVLSDLRTKLPYLLKQYPQFSKEQIEDIANQFDPTNNKVYIAWILKQIINGNFRITNNDGIMEDAFIVNRRLSQFEKIKNRDFFTHDKDINKYSTPKELYQTLDLYKEYLQDVNRKDQYKEEKKILEDTGYIEVYNKSPFRIVKVVSVPMAMELANGTSWCIQQEDSAKHYLKDGPLYFIYKNDEKYALLHAESSQLKNVDDHELEPEYREELEPIFVNNGIINNINYKYNILRNFKYKPTEAEMQYIINNVKLSYEYAKCVIGGRFELGEKVIATNYYYSFLYAKNVLKRTRFELGEKAIATDTIYSYKYAEEVIKGRFELGEPTIATNATCSYDYAEYVLKPLGINRFELGEKAIATDSRLSYAYAINCLKDRFELGEQAIFSSVHFSFLYFVFLRRKGYDTDKILKENGIDNANNRSK